MEQRRFRTSEYLRESGRPLEAIRYVKNVVWRARTPISPFRDPPLAEDVPVLKPMRADWLVSLRLLLDKGATSPDAAVKFSTFQKEAKALGGIKRNYDPLTNAGLIDWVDQPEGRSRWFVWLTTAGRAALNGHSSGLPQQAELVHEGRRKPCPYCGETILAVAKECKHCCERRDVPQPPAEGQKPVAPVPGTTPPNGSFTTGMWCALLGIGVLVLFTLLCSGSFSSDYSGTRETAVSVTENSYQRGAEAGRSEGRRAGEAEGFSASFNAAKKEAYEETVDELYQSRQFQRITPYTFAVVICFFFLGYVLQWFVLYVIRRIGLLLDIDWIVLPKEMTRVELCELDGPIPSQQKRLNLPSSGSTLLLLLTLLSIIGCNNREEKPWQRGYDANRNAAYQEGWWEGAIRGEEKGKERGKAEAQHAAQTGRAWHLYKTPAFLALMFGVIVGLAVQYTTLVCCNDAGCVHELVTVAFVPAMKHSLAYSILEHRRTLLIWWEKEMRRQAATKDAQVAHIQAVYEVVREKLKKMKTLEELTQNRILDLARQELSKIISDAEQKAVKPVNRAIACPHCGKPIGDPRKKAGKTVNCPYANCGRPIDLPSNGDGK